MNWLVAVLVCTIFVFIMTPIEKWLKRKITNKYYNYAVTFVVACVILSSMYFIAHIIGLPLYRD